MASALQPADEIRVGDRAQTDEIRVLVADPERTDRATLARLVELYDGVTVIATAGDAATALRAAVHLEPDVILIDRRLATTNVLATLIDFVGANTRFMVLSTYLDESSAIDHEAVTWLSKSSSADDLESSIRTAATRGH